jgi:3-phytase/alkaline phosphatase D
MRRAAALLLGVVTLACSSTPEPAPRFQRQGTAKAGSIGAAAAAAPRESPAIHELNSATAIEAARRDYGGARYLGEAVIVSGTTIDDVELGGLSGITWVGQDRYLAISDDRGTRGPGRFYELAVDLTGERLALDGLRVVGWTVLQGPGGRPLLPETFDLEGIAAATDGSVYVSSEGEARAEIAPFVAQFDRSGRHRGSLPLADKYLPSGDGRRGVRSNLALESLAIEPGGRYLFTATENALEQDGPEADSTHGSPSRILKFDLETGRSVGEYVYEVGRVSIGLPVLDSYQTAGLVDLIGLDPHHLLALERAFVAGHGFAERIYWVCLEEASNVIGLESIAGVSGLKTVDKQLFLDLADLDLRFDNLEGMTLGAPLGDDRRALVLIADNNFNATTQITQLVAFSVPAQLHPPR